jgi:hypothetical protein
MGGAFLNRPIVGMASTPNGGGYWLVAADGGVFSFGNARFYGSMGAIALNKPAVGMASTPDGVGYWLVASDGGIFSFGDAHFFGSAASIQLRKPVTGIAPTPDGKGYWLASFDGGVFTYGDAAFYGSAAQPGAPVTFIGPPMVSPDGHGYWLANAQDADACWAFGDVLSSSITTVFPAGCLSSEPFPSNLPAVYVGAATAFFQKLPPGAR